jgi:sec-independent protein translocase protein TatA
VGSGLLSPTHIIILLAIIALVFGARKLPELGHGLGEGMRNFKRGITGEDASTPGAPPPQQLASPPAPPTPPAAAETPAPAVTERPHVD